jgi:two-component system phosphate regulon sensor histidine kinase PhoR
VALASLGATLVAWWRHARRLNATLQQRDTDFRAREQQLLQEHDQFLASRDAVFHSLPGGLILLDPDGRVRLVNPAAHRLLHTPDAATGRSLLEVARHHELDSLASRVLTGGQTETLELEVTHAGAPATLLQVGATPFERPDAPGRGVILAFHDITRLKELERTRREFVANVSHELRTPLALIKGYVETLIDGARSNPEVAERFLRIIEKHTNRLAFLIDDLLTISQLESGTSVMNRRRTELQPLAQQVVTDLAARASDRAIQLRNDVPAGLEAHADPDRLHQVLVNLVDNAIKYGRHAGLVTLGAHLDPASHRLELWVTDDGPGIPREALDRIFERFYRVDAARSREQGGTGLGLSIVKHIIQAHGGEVRAESEHGRGATFRIRLPTAPD